MSQHTPGPWTQSTALSSDWPFIRYIDDANGDCVAHVRSGMKANDPPVFSQAEALANARLIMAAPELLQALEAVAPYLYALHDGENAADLAPTSGQLFAVNRAIAKARGAP